MVAECVLINIFDMLFVPRAAHLQVTATPRIHLGFKKLKTCHAMWSFMVQPCVTRSASPQLLTHQGSRHRLGWIISKATKEVSDTGLGKDCPKWCLYMLISSYCFSSSIHGLLRFLPTNCFLSEQKIWSPLEAPQNHRLQHLPPHLVPHAWWNSGVPGGKPMPS